MSGYFERLKEKIIQECLFKYVDSENGLYEKDQDILPHDFSYSGFTNFKAPKLIEPEFGTLEQKQFTLLDGNGFPLTEEKLEGSNFTDAQIIATFLSYYFFSLVQNIPGFKSQKISNPNELESHMSSLVKYDLTDVVMLLDVMHLSELKKNQLKGTITHHQPKAIYYNSTFNHLYPVMYVPRLNLQDILIFNRNYSFCYSDLNIYLEDNKVKVKVSVGLQNTNSLKLLNF